MTTLKQSSYTLYSVQRQISDGNLEVVTVRIPYYSKDTLHVLIDDTQITSQPTENSPYTWQWDGDTIRITPKVAKGSQVMVRRRSDAGAIKNIFNGQAQFTDVSVDQNFQQLLWLAQQFLQGSGQNQVFSDFDMHGYRLINLGNPKQPNDAVTLEYLQNYVQNVPGSAFNAVSFQPQTLSNQRQWQARDNITALGGYEYISQKSKLVALQLDKIKEMYDSNIAFKNLLNRNETQQTDYDCFIIAGQSNSVGQGKQKSKQRATDCGLYLDWTGNSSPSNNKYDLKPIADPICRSSTGTAWPAFARLYKKLTGRNVLLLSTGWGGSCVVGSPFVSTSNTWAPNGFLRTLASANWKALSSICKRRKITYTLKGILWVQGQADAGFYGSQIISLEDYRDATYDIWNWFRQLVQVPDLPIFFSRIGSHELSRLKQPYKILGDYQQKTFPSIANNIALAFNRAPLFFQTGMMSDSVHYTQAGYNMMGQAFARKVTSFRR